MNTKNNIERVFLNWYLFRKINFWLCIVVCNTAMPSVSKKVHIKLFINV